MLEHSFHLSSFTDSGVQRNRDAGRRNRKGERGGGREEEAEEVFINHSDDCVAPLLVLFIWADALCSGPHCTLLLLSSIKSTVSQSSAEPTVSVNVFVPGNIFKNLSNKSVFRFGGYQASHLSSMYL